MRDFGAATTTNKNNNRAAPAVTMKTVIAALERYSRMGLVAVLLAGCGGGGGGGPSAPAPIPAPSPPPAPTPAPPTPTTPTNLAPMVTTNVTEITASGHYEFRFDASQGGTTFTDPDGDPLSYTVSMNGVINTDGPFITLPMPSFPR